MRCSLWHGSMTTASAGSTGSVAIDRSACAGGDQIGHFGGRALAQAQLHVGVARDETAQHAGQRIARLRVRGGDRQRAFALRRVFARCRLDALRRIERALGHRDDLAARFGEAHQARAVAHEKLDAEFLLEQPQLPAQARLRDVQRGGGARNVEVPARDFAEVAQLLQGHSGHLHTKSYGSISYHHLPV